MHPILARRGRLGPYLVAWLPLAAVFAALTHLVTRSAWPEAVILALPLTMLYALMCLAAWHPCRIAPLGRESLERVLGVHAAAAALSALLWLFFATTWAVFLDQFPPFAGLAERFPRMAVVLVVAAFLLYAMAAALHYLVIAFERARAADRRELELEVHAREAELKALRAQVDPHFLFNALNSIAALIGSDPRLAREMCLTLGEFLRDSLRLGGRGEITLGEELELARSYLAVEQVRFGPRMRLDQVVDPAASACLVPSLILQPLVENAIGRGIATLVDGGAVRVRVTRQGERLEVVVENPFEAASVARGEGLGLANVRSRLAAVYGAAASLEIESAPPLFRVRLTVPVRDAVDSAGLSAGSGRTGREAVPTGSVTPGGVIRPAAVPEG